MLFFTTFTGSMTPHCKRSSTFSEMALNPKEVPFSSTSCKQTEGSNPVLRTICLKGASQALSQDCSADVSSLLSGGSVSEREARRRATPPPGTIPSSRAARVAFRLSSKSCFFFFISDSVGAPTLMTQRHLGVSLSALRVFLYRKSRSHF